LDRYNFALYAHFLAIVAAVVAATLLHVNFVRLRRATRVAEARDAIATIARTAPFMPMFALALLATGAFLVALRWAWHDGWVIAGIVGLVSMPLVSLIVMKPRLQTWARTLGEAKDGPLDAALAAPLQDRVAWGAMTYNHVVSLAVMLVMVLKLTLVPSLGVLLVAPVIGAWSALSAGKFASRAATSADMSANRS
jgi:hypothetical protein